MDKREKPRFLMGMSGQEGERVCASFFAPCFLFSFMYVYMWLLHLSPTPTDCPQPIQIIHLLPTTLPRH